MPRVGDKIKKYRLEKGMTQEELGNELGVGKAAVQKYESGQVQNLKSAHIKRLCELFNKTPWDFIFDGDQPQNHSHSTLESIRLLREAIGDETVQYLTPLLKLNTKGLEKLKDYALDLGKIDEYKL